MRIKGATVFANHETIPAGEIVVEGGVFSYIGPGTEKGKEDSETLSFPEKYMIIPGFIDLHIHGAKGADTMDADLLSMENFSAALGAEGTTAFLATTITHSAEAIEKALANIRNYMSIQSGNKSLSAEVLGVHLEGPFLNEAFAGAQPKDKMLAPDAEQLKAWMEVSGEAIRQITLAPELPGASKLISYCRRAGITVSMGHSGATLKEAFEAADAGATQVTHLYNGMSGLHHREPGLAAAALLNYSLYAEVIADGEHIHPDMVNFAYQLLGPDRMILITDAMRAKGLSDGVYDLGGQPVEVEKSRATLSDGRLAGSVLKMNEAFRNTLSYTGASIRDAIKMSSENAARQAGVFNRKGSLAKGKDGDFVVLDEDFEVVLTVRQGEIIYKREGV